MFLKTDCLEIVSKSLHGNLSLSFFFFLHYDILTDDTGKLWLTFQDFSDKLYKEYFANAL